MPFYEYKCVNCENNFEIQQNINDDPLKTCTQCGKEDLKRVFHTSAIIFKGSGFYTTDYKKKGK